MTTQWQQSTRQGERLVRLYLRKRSIWSILDLIAEMRMWDGGRDLRTLAAPRTEDRPKPPGWVWPSLTFRFLFVWDPPVCVSCKVKNSSGESHNPRAIPAEFQTSASASSTVIPEAGCDTATRAASRRTRQALEAGIPNIQNISAAAISN